MKITVDEKDLYELSETQINVIAYYINRNDLDSDLKRRLQWVLMHLYDECFKKLKVDWEPKLATLGIEMIPTDKDAFANLVFAQPEYKDRLIRDLEREDYL